MTTASASAAQDAITTQPQLVEFKHQRHIEIYEAFIKALPPNDYQGFIREWDKGVKVVKPTLEVSTDLEYELAVHKDDKYQQCFKYYMHVLTQYKETKEEIEHKKSQIKLANLTAKKLVTIVVETFIKDLNGELDQGFHQKIDDSDFAVALNTNEANPQDTVIIHWLSHQILGKGGDGHVDRMFEIVSGQFYAIKYPKIPEDEPLSEDAKKQAESEASLTVQQRSEDIKKTSEEMKELISSQEKELNHAFNRFSFEIQALEHLRKYPSIRKFISQMNFYINIERFYFYAQPIFAMNLDKFIKTYRLDIYQKLFVGKKLIQAVFNFHYLRGKEDLFPVGAGAHRDLSTGNFLVTPGDDISTTKIVLTDFARATFKEFENPYTRDYQAQPGYYGPSDQSRFAKTEKLLADKVLSKEQAFEEYQKLDIFALAVTIYKLLTDRNRWPFGSDDISKQSSEPDLKEIEMNFPAECKKILLEMMGQDVLKRPSINRVFQVWNKMMVAFEMDNKQAEFSKETSKPVVVHVIATPKSHSAPAEIATAHT